jgi:hypothetical protein
VLAIRKKHAVSGFEKNEQEQGMKTFLKSFASVLAGFAASQAGASVAPMGDTSPSLQQDHQAQHRIQPASSPVISVKNGNGDKFNFVLKHASDTGLLMAMHESHASHASHSSHYSSRY